MGRALRKLWVCEADYLASEERAPVKSEYVAGEVYAMAGASARHNKIAGNLYVRLHEATRGSHCEVFMSDMKVRVQAHRAFYYPDVMLVCEPDDQHPLYRSAPCLLAEVLSPTTAGIDEREKWLHYRDIPALRYYLLVDSEQRFARVRSRVAEGWLEQTLDEDDRVVLECGPVRVSLGLDDLYERTGL